MNVQSEERMKNMVNVENKKQAILDATLRLIYKNGFHGTSMSMVSKEAGVSAGIIYHYFKNKDELIQELYRNIHRQFAKITIEQIDNSKPLVLQLRNVCEATFRYSFKNPLNINFLQQFMMSPYYAMEIELEVREELNIVEELLERGIKEMVLKDFPLEVIAIFIADAAGFLARKQCISLVNVDDDMLQKIIDTTWEAIKL